MASESANVDSVVESSNIENENNNVTHQKNGKAKKSSDKRLNPFAVPEEVAPKKPKKVDEEEERRLKELEEQRQQRKAEKREKRANREKKKKPKPEEEQPTATDESGNVLPTPKLSKRQKKKLKLKDLNTKQKTEEIEKTREYLTKWDTCKEEWKFMKLRQMFIQKHILCVNVIDDEHIDVAIRYLATSQGNAKTVLLKAAEVNMKSIEDKITDENRDELLNSVGYTRSRQLIQALQD